MEAPPDFRFKSGDIQYLIGSIEKRGLLKVDLGLGEEIRLARTRALKRSQQVGLLMYGRSQANFWRKALNSRPSRD